MLFADTKTETQTFEEIGDELLVSVTQQETPIAAAELSVDEPTETDLFHLYEKIAQARPGTKDAEIFEKLHEWSFSDFSIPPHEFVGVSAGELKAWQKRHRINLSSGHIRPAHVDLARGHAWGQIRRDLHVNKIHAYIGPPSAEELEHMIWGYAY
jgi:hypothetical protein